MSPAPPARTRPLRVAVLDLYNGEANLGLNAICSVLDDFDGRLHNQRITFKVFETRLKDELPGLDYDVYISSGGPGSPFDGQGLTWETRYFRWLEAIWNHNAGHAHSPRERKFAFFICHSFQMMCRFFEVAAVTERKSESFGIFPVHQTAAGLDDPLFEHLSNPFYAADFRHWQVLRPDRRALDDLGASILALEKERPYVALERAIMALRITPELAGVQFHPEADPPGMWRHFHKPERKAKILEAHGQAKFTRILRRLQDPDYLRLTHRTVLPNFLQQAIETLRPGAIQSRQLHSGD